MAATCAAITYYSGELIDVEFSLMKRETDAEENAAAKAIQQRYR